jgi:hypothetical protein
MSHEFRETRPGEILDRQRELEALAASPAGLQELATIFRKTVLLAGEYMPPGLPADAMISDIMNVEFRKLQPR